MSATVPYSLKSAGTTAATSVASFTAPSLGDTLLAMIAVPTANAPATAIVDDTGYDYLASPDLVVAGLNSHTYYFVRRSNISGSAPSSISVTGTTGSFSATVEVARVTGLASASPVESTFNNQLSSNTSQSTHTHTYTTLAANVFVWAGLSTYSDRNLISASNGFLIVPTESGGSRHHVAYKEDAGAIGTYTTDLGLQGGDSYAQAIGVIYKTGASGPTVSSNPDVTVTEGSPATHTVTLSATTTAVESYPVTLAPSGTYPATGGGTDFTDTLASATFESSGVMYSAGNLLVPIGVLSFPVVISTASDLLDENNETYTLTVGGVASVCTIVDDDATPVVIIPGPATVDGGDSVVLSYSIPVVSGRVTQARLVLADGTAVGGTNYTNVITDLMLSNGVTISAGVLSIPAGVAGFTITIPTAG